MVPCSDSEDSDSGKQQKKSNNDESPGLPSEYEESPRHGAQNSATLKETSKSPLLGENQGKLKQRRGEVVTLKNKNGEK